MSPVRHADSTRWSPGALSIDRVSLPRLAITDHPWLSEAVEVPAGQAGELVGLRTRRLSDGSLRVRPMFVFSNQRLGPVAEVLVSPEVAEAMLFATAEAARPVAEGRWELELVRWLEDRSRTLGTELDVGELAWSPENFARQRAFLLGAIELASQTSVHARALVRWSQMIAAHPREWVVVGRRWTRPSDAAST